MIAYLGSQDFIPELTKEIANIQAVHSGLVLADGPLQRSVWSQNIWLQPEILSFKSIGEAVKILKSRGKLWTPYNFQLHRRSQLIQEQLPSLKARVIDFMAPLPANNVGAWTLLDENTLLLSPITDSPFPLGQVAFNEDKVHPPSRAYLKLWEFFTLYGIKPSPGEKVVDFGSCPGGWTWVLQQMGCEVISIDRAPLAPQVERLPRITFMKTNAFSLKPADIGKIDWFFSDIICYPEKLYELITMWQESGLCQNFVCTIKFQGKTDFEALRKFQALPHATVKHLFHNKHEVTVWIHQLPSSV